MNLINKILIIVVAATAFYAIFLIYSDLEFVKDRLYEFKVEFLLPILALVITSWFVVFVRWLLLLKYSDIRIPTSQSFPIFMSGIALSIIPGKIGELIKSQLLKTKFNIPRTKTAPIVILEQIYNLIGIVTLSCIGLGIMLTLEIEFFQMSNYVVIAATIVLIALLSLIHSKKTFEKLFLKISKFKFISKYEISFEDGYSVLKKLLKGKVLILSICLSSLFWFLESIIVYLILLAFNVDVLQFITIIATYTSSIILGVVSFLPMGVGVVEGSLAGFLSLQGIDISLALTIVVFIRIFTRWIGITFGFILLKITGGFSMQDEKIN